MNISDKIIRNEYLDDTVSNDNRDDNEHLDCRVSTSYFDHTICDERCDNMDLKEHSWF